MASSRNNNPSPKQNSPVNEADSTSNNVHMAHGNAAAQEAIMARMPAQVDDVEFDLNSKLGFGAFSCVFKGSIVLKSIILTDACSGHRRSTNQAVAVKAVALTKSSIQPLQNELRIHQQAVGHQNIAQLLGHATQNVRAYQLQGASASLIYLAIQEISFLFLELCQREVFDVIVAAEGAPRLMLPSIFAQLVEAVIFLHSQGISHLDIKPEVCSPCTHLHQILI